MILFKGLSNYRCVDQHILDISNEMPNDSHNDEIDWVYCRVGNCPSD